MTEEVKPNLSEKELFNKAQALYAEIILLEDDLKSLKEDHKDSDMDITLIFSLAKAAAAGKIGKIREKAENQIEMIDNLM